MSELAQIWRSQLSERSPDDARGPAWLQALRGLGAEAFERHGLPHRKVEDWKYTSLKLLEARSQKLADSREEPVGEIWPRAIAAPDCPVIRLANGRPGEIVSSAAGAEIHSLADLLQDEPPQDWVRPLAESLDMDGAARAFAALNASTLGTGLVIRIPAGIDAGPLLLQWAFTPAAPALLFNSRVLIRLEAGASLTLLEQFQTSAPHAHALNLVTQVELAEGARLSHVRLQQEADEAALITRTECRLSSAASYALTAIDIGGGLVRHDTAVELAKAGAEADVNGVIVVGGESHVDHHVSIDHAAGPSRSGQFFRCVLGGRSRGVYNGKAKIRPGADGSVVRQSNANLLVSPLAEIDTKPELEIYADEVEASHGATVGQLDEDAVFYLRTRGIDEDQARGMLTGAFCRTVLEREPKLGKVLAGLISERLECALANIVGAAPRRELRPGRGEGAAPTGAD